MGGRPGNKPKQGRWQKGQSGNPNGRPGGYGEFREKCRARTDKALAALEAALQEPANAVAAARVLLEFGWGKPKQSVELEGADGGPLQVVIEKLPEED